jgi:hypothetical protein
VDLGDDSDDEEDEEAGGSGSEEDEYQAEHPGDLEADVESDVWAVRGGARERRALFCLATPPRWLSKWARACVTTHT